MTTLVYGQSLLTGSLDQPEISGGGLVVDEAVIVEVGRADELRRKHTPDREIGGSDRVVLPGLVSAHQHGGGVSLTQLGCPDQAFERWIIRALGVPPLDPYLDTLYLAVRFIECGITTTIHSHYTRDPSRYDDEIESHLRAWAESGIRVAFAPCFLNGNQFVYDSNERFIESLPDDLAAQAKRLLDLGADIGVYLDLVADLRNRFKTSDRARVLLGPVAPQWCSKEALERMAAEGRPSEGVHAHLLETASQRNHLDAWLDDSVVAWMDRLGFLSPAASFAHGVWLRPDEIALLAERGVHLVHNPSSNLRLENGIAPIRELREAGVSVALGTDDMSLGENDDLLAEARLAGVLARLRGARLESVHLLNMATERGAAAARFGELTGVLAPGKRADVVLVDATTLEEPAVHEEVSILNRLLARGFGSDIRTVLIDGKVVLDERRHTWIDRAALVAELRQVIQQQTSDPRWRRMADVGDRLARAWDADPKPGYSPDVRLQAR